jgi:hypothetical protein
MSRAKTNTKTHLSDDWEAPFYSRKMALRNGSQSVFVAKTNARPQSRAGSRDFGVRGLSQ